MTALIIIAAVLILVIILLFILCAFIFNQLVWCKTIPIPKFIEKMIAGNVDMTGSKFKADSLRAVRNFKKLPLEKIEMKTDNGILKANLLVPEKSNGRLIIACHGARSSGIGEFCFMGDYFYKNNYTVLLPEHRGCGKSDGKFMGYGTHESEDTLLWLKYAEKRFPNLSVYLLGVSMGAATVLMMSNKVSRSEVKGIVADCAYTSAWDEFKYQMKKSFHLPPFPILNICNLYCKIFSKYSFRQASPIKSVSRTDIPVLFIHGKADDYVPFYMEDLLFKNCSSPIKHKIAVDGAVHARSYYTNPKYYEQSLEKFFDETEKSV
uniref:alpha/beta hydrolase n=1 Tax=Eubacterium sp. TaxID=142586 RepID=UPI004027F0FD